MHCFVNTDNSGKLSEILQQKKIVLEVY